VIEFLTAQLAHEDFGKPVCRSPFFSSPLTRLEYKASCIAAKLQVPRQGIAQRPVTDTIARRAQEMPIPVNILEYINIDVAA
jgi:hypothetical protein